MERLRMERLLTWSEIKRRYRGFWVEVVDLVWDASGTIPLSGRVRNFAPDRIKLSAETTLSSETTESAIIYLGSTHYFGNAENTSGVLESRVVM
jgi:hypothetical protein